jgi:hypothetical protein
LVYFSGTSILLAVTKEITGKKNTQTWFVGKMKIVINFPKAESNKLKVERSDLYFWHNFPFSSIWH